MGRTTRTWRTSLVCLFVMLTLVDGAVPPMHEMLQASKPDGVGRMKMMLSVLTRGWPDPSGSQSNRTILLQLLGDNFDRNYMSIRSPRPIGHEDTRVNRKRPKEVKSNMPWALRKLQFEINRSDVTKSRVLGDKASSKLRMWLWELSRCAVEHRWLDLGPKFFPRYIKDGACPKRSCSYPEGMRCHTETTRSLKLLIWLCSNTAGRGCRWASFVTETISKCKCGCRDST